MVHVSKCMFGSTLKLAKIDSKSIKLILTYLKIDSAFGINSN
jgi:hypothetical protein